VGVQHQVCKAHVLRNTEALIERYQPLVARDADGSLQAIGVSPQQAAADLTRLGELVKSRQREQANALEALQRRYRTWKGPKGETLDGTNNACERAIGWWIKERYRTMRGYKIPENAVRVSRLLAWCGNFLTAEHGANLPALLQ